MLKLLGNPWVLAGVALGAGYYAYTRMSSDQREELLDRGKKLVSNLPLGSVKDAWSKVGV